MTGEWSAKPLGTMGYTTFSDKPIWPKSPKWSKSSKKIRRTPRSIRSFKTIGLKGTDNHGKSWTIPCNIVMFITGKTICIQILCSIWAKHNTLLHARRRPAPPASSSHRSSRSSTGIPNKGAFQWCSKWCSKWCFNGVSMSCWKSWKTWLQKKSVKTEEKIWWFFTKLYLLKR